MTIKEITRLAVYALAILIGAIIAVIAAVRGDAPLLATAIAWIGTNVLAAVNVNGNDTPAHALE